MKILYTKIEFSHAEKKTLLKYARSAMGDIESTKKLDVIVEYLQNNDRIGLTPNTAGFLAAIIQNPGPDAYGPELDILENIFNTLLQIQESDPEYIDPAPEETREFDGIPF